MTDSLRVALFNPCLVKSSPAIRCARQGVPWRCSVSSRPRLLVVAPAEMTHSPVFDRALALAKAIGASLTLVAFVYLEVLQQLDLLDAGQRQEVREMNL